MRDLLRLPAAPGLSAKFSTDATGTFANNGEALSVSDTLRIDYQTAAETLAQKVARDPAALAPHRSRPARPPAAASARPGLHPRLRPARLPPSAGRPGDDGVHRPVRAGARPGRRASTRFAAGAQLVLEAMLQSPHFLYRTELGDRARAASAWATTRSPPSCPTPSPAPCPTMPCSTAAAGGALAQPRTGGRRRPSGCWARAARPGVTFHEELFAPARAGRRDREGPAALPGVQAGLARLHRRRRARCSWARSSPAAGASAELLTAPFTFVDATLAPLYGVKAPAAGSDFAPRRAGPAAAGGPPDPDRLSGPVRRDRARSHPARRLHQPEAALPGPGAAPGRHREHRRMPPASARTNRERVAAVTSPPACAACHQAFINPAGFAFENYDALGRLPDHRQRPADQRGRQLRASPRARRASRTPSSSAACWRRAPRSHDCYAAQLVHLSCRAARSGRRTSRS